jgi:hypothetical protein
MNKDDKSDEKEIQKTMLHRYQGTKGGIFANKSRERIAGVSNLSKRYRTEKQFWAEMTSYIKPALFDLELLIKYAHKEDINQIINYEALKPVVYSILSLKKRPSDKTRAEIAQLFIMAGFDYLLHWPDIPVGSIKKDIEKAEELSNFFVKSLGGEPRYFSSATIDALRT